MAKKINKQENKKAEIPTKPIQPKLRQVIIETDGSNIKIAKNETAGNLELVALLSTVLTKLQTPS